MPPVPVSIKLKAPGGIAIRWSDEHDAIYPHAHLRRNCPCAACRERPPEVLTEAGAFPIYGKEAIKAFKAEPVGRYAIQFYWNDSHSSGIYTFSYLRELCPCAECHPESNR